MRLPHTASIQLSARGLLGGGEDSQGNRIQLLDTEALLGAAWCLREQSLGRACQGGLQAVRPFPGLLDLPSSPFSYAEPGQPHWEASKGPPQKGPQVIPLSPHQLRVL